MRCTTASPLKLLQALAKLRDAAESLPALPDTAAPDAPPDAKADAELQAAAYLHVTADKPGSVLRHARKSSSNDAHAGQLQREPVGKAHVVGTARGPVEGTSQPAAAGSIQMGLEGSGTAQPVDGAAINGACKGANVDRNQGCDGGAGAAASRLQAAVDMEDDPFGLGALMGGAHQQQGGGGSGSRPASTPAKSAMLGGSTQAQPSTAAVPATGEGPDADPFGLDAFLGGGGSATACIPPTSSRPHDVSAGPMAVPEPRQQQEAGPDSADRLFSDRAGGNVTGGAAVTGPLSSASASASASQASLAAASAAVTSSSAWGSVELVAARRAAVLISLRHAWSFHKHAWAQTGLELLVEHCWRHKWVVAHCAAAVTAMCLAVVPHLFVLQAQCCCLEAGDHAVSQVWAEHKLWLHRQPTGPWKAPIASWTVVRPPPLVYLQAVLHASTAR
jgi:hypothetical protein